VTTGTPALMMPAFSLATSGRVGPQELDVVQGHVRQHHDVGFETTFVASSRPPSPTSTTAVSTPASAMARNAMAVVASKKEGSSRRMSRPEPVGRVQQGVLLDGAAVNADAFPERAQVRRRIQRDGRPVPAQHTFEVRSDGTLAVRAADVQDAVGAVGVAYAASIRRVRSSPQRMPPGQPGEQLGDELVVRQASPSRRRYPAAVSPLGSAGTGRPSMCRSTRRSLT
jgi:hypothetical protein